MKLVYYRHNKKESMLAMKKHKISCHELTFVLSGSLQYTIDNISYPLAAGDIIYVKKGSERSRLEINNADYVSFNFTCLDDLDFSVKIENGVSDVIRLLIQAFDCVFKYTTNLEDERYLQIFNCLLLQLNKQQFIKTESPIIAQIKKFIKQNYMNKISLKDVASHVFVSPIYCEFLFKKETGKSIIDYLIDERINQAKILLYESGIPLAKIAIRVGFNDYNYFCRIFKKRTGYPPLQYKKQFTNYGN